MQVLISAEGDHDPQGHHYMVVDRRGVLLDLTGVTGTLHDPTIARAEWGQIIDGRELREGGRITLRDGSSRTFFDKALLKPYLTAFDARQDKIALDQAAFDSAARAAQQAETERLLAMPLPDGEAMIGA